MKKILVLLVFIGLFGLIAFTQARTIKIRGYIKPSTGRYVMPYYKTSPNKTRFDNFSTKGSYNPFTGKKGYTSPIKSYRLK